MKKCIPDLFAGGLIVAALICYLVLFSAPPLRLHIPGPESRGVQNEAALWQPPRSAAETLAQRNLFSAEGRYATPWSGTDEAGRNDIGTLEAVLVGQKREALFRRKSGEIVVLHEGDTMPDGGVVVGISLRSVKVKRGEKIENMRVFNIGSD